MDKSPPAPSDDHVLRCAWLMNPDEIPRQNVRITLLRGDVQEITSVPTDEVRLIEPIVVLPALVNAHTHLEFSNLKMPIKPRDPFTDWIRNVVRYRASEDDASIGQSVESGVRECVESGTRFVGEITTSDVGQHALLEGSSRHQLGAVSFRELISFLPQGIDDQLAIAQRHVSYSDHERCVAGLSPHAPYSVHPQLFEAVIDLAAERNRPVAMHLAETTDELELLDRQSGRFVDFLSAIKLWDSSVLTLGTRPLRYLQKLAQLSHSLAIHGNYFDSPEIAFLAAHPNIAVVYCPRTHAYFGHTAHPWQRLREVGATVILGTDSRASNPDLAVWSDLQFVARQSQLPIYELLPMVTTTAAVALGGSADDFRIMPGKEFRGVSIPCEANSVAQLEAALLQSTELPRPFGR